LKEWRCFEPELRIVMGRRVQGGLQLGLFPLQPVVPRFGGGAGEFVPRREHALEIVDTHRGST